MMKNSERCEQESHFQRNSERRLGKVEGALSMDIGRFDPFGWFALCRYLHKYRYISLNSHPLELRWLITCRVASLLTTI